MCLKKYLFLLFFLLLLQHQYAQVFRVSYFEIVGVKKIKKAYLKKVLLSKVGIALDSVLIAQDIAFLKRLPAVSNADYEVKKESKNNYQLKITIEENFTSIPELNFWTTTNKQFAYKVGFYDYNFLGRNMVIGGFYQNNAFHSYGINYRAPNLFSKKLGLTVSHQNWKSEEPLYFGHQSANYLYTNIFFEDLGLYQMNLKNSINFGLNVFSEKYAYLSGVKDAAIPLNLELDKKFLKLVYQYNNLGYFYQYIRGFKSVLCAQFVTSNNVFQDDFIIAWNDFFYYKRIGTKGNWASRLRLGFSSNEASPFALDKNVNIRGEGILVDRGSGVAVLNTEYRHTVYDKKWLAIQTNVFTDIGSWRNPGGAIMTFLKVTI